MGASIQTVTRRTEKTRRVRRQRWVFQIGQATWRLLGGLDGVVVSACEAHRVQRYIFQNS